jgi:Restriction endonuclease AspBHI N-terminal/Restriction endonuclease
VGFCCAAPRSLHSTRPVCQCQTVAYGNFAKPNLLRWRRYDRAEGDGAATRLRSVSQEQQKVGFDRLVGADLVIDRIYEGGGAGNAGDDPLNKLLPVGNQGGFRTKGSPKGDSVKVAVLYTSGAEPDWPDALDPHTGVFTYFGDNRSPGRLLEDTPRNGNRLLSRVFAKTHGQPADRAKVPPFLLFDKPGGGRNVRFRGLLAPGSSQLSAEEDLVAVWRTTRGERFQNYRAHFTVLDVPVVSRPWIKQLVDGEPLGGECPSAWRAWVESRTYTALVAPPTVIIRSRDEQEPLPQDRQLLGLVCDHFAPNPYGFEQFAADLWAKSERNVDKIDVTRPWRDGGRDAVGDYLIGPPSDPVAVELALEAKCYALGNGVGVRQTSRLISRLRHRQFGVLITTSHVDAQAYKEIREDGHPVVILAGRDIVEMLKRSGFDTSAALRKHLVEKYPQREPF